MRALLSAILALLSISVRADDVVAHRWDDNDWSPAMATTSA
jgi:hypothetical protein